MIQSKSSVLISAIICLAFLACGQKQSDNEIREKLKATMSLYLNHDREIDSTKVRFTVLDVTYSETAKEYNCRFKVNMKDRNSGVLKDTTGIMASAISKDFRDVTRKY